MREVASFRLAGGRIWGYPIRWHAMSANLPVITPSLYKDVFERFAHDSVRYVVVSGMAVVFHGHARPVADLDIVVDPNPQQSELALRSLLALLFVPTIPVGLSSVSVLRLFDPSSREVDLFVRYHVPFAELFADSEDHAGWGTRARVASLAHVLRVKRLLERPHDLLDIDALQLLHPQ